MNYQKMLTSLYRIAAKVGWSFSAASLIVISLQGAPSRSQLFLFVLLANLFGALAERLAAQEFWSMALKKYPLYLQQEQARSFVALMSLIFAISLALLSLLAMYVVVLR